MVNANVRAAIEDLGVKQKFIAEKTGISETSLSAMLNEKQKISADDFFAIAYALRIQPEDLYNYKAVAS